MTTANREINVSPRMLRSEPMQRCTLGMCKGACCLFGVWLDEMEAQDLLIHASLIQPFMTNGITDPNDWFDGRIDEDPHSHSGRVMHSLVVDDETHYGGLACVFLRSDHKCALQAAAVRHGFHPWHFKPFYCILHPLVLDEEGQITLDETKLLLDEPGSCLVPADHLVPLVETFEPELRYLLGNKKFTEILRRSKSADPDR